MFFLVDNKFLKCRENENTLEDNIEVAKFSYVLQTHIESRHPLSSEGGVE